MLFYLGRTFTFFQDMKDLLCSETKLVLHRSTGVETGIVGLVECDTLVGMYVYILIFDIFSVPKI